MFPLFFMSTLWIWTAGPGINEHGIKATQNKGFKVAIEQAWSERESLVADRLGNYGNK